MNSGCLNVIGRRARKRLRISVVIFGMVMFACTVSPASVGAEGAHKHHASVIAGVTEKSGESAWTYGFEYAFRLNNRWALGGWYEESTGDFELGSLGVQGNFFLTENFPLLIGIGAERELFGETKYLARLGAQYQFHTGPISIAPAGWIDLVENGNELYFIGVLVGIGF